MLLPISAVTTRQALLVATASARVTGAAVPATIPAALSALITNAYLPLAISAPINPQMDIAIQGFP